MTSGREIHRASTFVLSFLMLVIGIALTVQALAGHGGPASARMLLGLLFIAAGVGRGYLEVRRRRGA